MKKVLKKIYDVLPNGIKKLYWQTRKKVGQILMFRIVFPLGYKHYIKRGRRFKREKKQFLWKFVLMRLQTVSGLSMIA